MKSNEEEKVRPAIFLVDDDIDYLEQLRIQVERLGYTVITANGQKEAERMLEAFIPDLVIYDLMMENKDSGFILAYKTKKKYPEVPVIIATAASAETGIIFSLEKEADKQWIRADKYLEKGLRTDQLQREINKLLFSK
jgi:CheY-like chemotaxis protein